MSILVINPKTPDGDFIDDRHGLAITFSKNGLEDLTSTKISKYVDADGTDISSLIYQNLSDDVNFVVIPFSTDHSEIEAILRDWQGIRILSFSFPCIVRYNDSFYEVRGTGNSFICEWQTSVITGGVQYSIFTP